MVVVLSIFSTLVHINSVYGKKVVKLPVNINETIFGLHKNTKNHLLV